MSKLAKVLQAAAGNAGGAGELAAAIDFDGSTDSLTRTSDLIGNSDGKTFTFSAWLYYTEVNGTIIESGSDASGGNGWGIKTESNGLVIWGASPGGGFILYGNKTYVLAKDTFNHILVSINLASPSQRHVYVNDVDITSSINWQYYTNSNIDFTTTNWSVGYSKQYNYYRIKARLSNIYLDKTYRDLSNVNNRRLFITADLKTAEGQADLNPILYLPFGDPEDIGYNAGTGGDFTANGVMARSGRGPNQDNCVASYFSGSSDNLYRAGAYGADSKTLTISFCYSSKSANTQIFNSEIASGDDNIYVIPQNATGGLQIGTLLNNASNYAVVVSIPSTVVTHNSTHAISVSFDSSDTSKRHVFVDGVDKTASVTWNYYNLNSFVGFSLTSRTRLGAGWASGSNSYFWGNLGEFYLSKDYTNLASDNPFWDSDLNKPIPIRKVLADTGNTPLIAMPIEANNAGLNLGTSGNFTVNSGPYTGARGASEHWSRSMNKNTWVNNSTLSVSTKTFSFVFAVKPPDTTARHAINWTNGRFDLCIPSTTTERLYYGAGGTSINIRHNLYMGGVSEWYIYFVSVDMDDQSKTRWYVKPLNTIYTLAPSLIYSSFTTGEPVTFANFAVNMQSGYTSNYEMSSVYFTTSYIDFSQEAERLKFIDAFGYPLDISKQIEDGIVPAPTFYLPFDTPTNFGKNLGSGGDFTVNGANQFNGSDVSAT